MRKNQKKRRFYEKPQIQVIGLEPCCNLLAGSISGGHHGATDDGDELNAKRGWFEEESLEN